MSERNAVPPPKKFSWLNCFGTFTSWTFLVLYLVGWETLLLRDMQALLLLGYAVIVVTLFNVIAGVLPKKSPFSAFALFMLILFAIFLHTMAHQYFLEPIWISKQTTHITEPRTPNGRQVDFFAAIEQRLAPNVSPEDNGFRVLAETFGSEVFDKRERDFFWPLLCEKLQIDENLQPALVFQDVSDFFEQQKQLDKQQKSELVRRLLEKPWTAEEFPDAARWLQENNAALDQLQIALQKPMFFMPMLRKNDGLLLFNMSDRNGFPRWLARELQIRVQFHLGNGDTEKAWADVRTMFVLAERLRRHSVSRLDVLVANCVQDYAMKSVVAVLHGGKMDVLEIALAKWLAEIEPFLSPDYETAAHNADWAERLAVLHGLQFMADGSYFASTEYLETQGGDWKAAWPSVFIRGVPWNRAMTHLNARIDAAEQGAVVQEKDDLLRDFSWKKIVYLFAKYGKARLITMAVTDVAFYLWSGGKDGMLASMERQKAVSSLVRTAFSLEQFRQEHGGAYPQSLAELESVSEDPFSPGDLPKYKRGESDHEYLLYSVGPNGLDNGGEQPPRFDKGKDDVVIKR